MNAQDDKQREIYRRWLEGDPIRDLARQFRPRNQATIERLIRAEILHTHQVIKSRRLHYITTSKANDIRRP